MYTIPNVSVALESEFADVKHYRWRRVFSVKLVPRFAFLSIRDVCVKANVSRFLVLGGSSRTKQDGEERKIHDPAEFPFNSAGSTSSRVNRACNRARSRGSEEFARHKAETFTLISPGEIAVSFGSRCRANVRAEKIVSPIAGVEFEARPLTLTTPRWIPRFEASSAEFATCLCALDPFRDYLFCFSLIEMSAGAKRSIPSEGD